MKSKEKAEKLGNVKRALAEKYENLGAVTE